MVLVKGKKGLIMGVANERSIAWGISKKLAENGAELAFRSFGDFKICYKKIKAKYNGKAEKGFDSAKPNFFASVKTSIKVLFSLSIVERI